MKAVRNLSYVKLSGILWGVCREQQQKIQHKIEWLESSVYELIEEVKELKGKKQPKAKAKAKGKAANNLVDCYIQVVYIWAIQTQRVTNNTLMK